MKIYILALCFCLGSCRPGVDPSQLLMGTLVKQGETAKDALEGFPDLPFEMKKGKEVAKEAEIEMIQPGKELLVGQQLGEFNKRPNEEELSMAGVAPNAHLETKQGKVLDQDIESGRYVANPSKVLGELLASGQPTPEIVEGEILAGDFVDAKVDVLTELRA